MRLAMRRDCTGEPPGELTMMATAGAALMAKARFSSGATPGDVEPAGPLVGGDDALQADHRDDRAAAPKQALQPIARALCAMSSLISAARDVGHGGGNYQWSRACAAEDRIELGPEVAAGELRAGRGAASSVSGAREPLMPRIRTRCAGSPSRGAAAGR